MNIESQVLNVPIEDIIPNRFQPRLNFDEGALKELAASIKEHGIIQPLVLRRLNEKYEIIAGERRYKAAKLAGLTSVPAIISTINDNQSAEVAIVENIQRKDLSSIEEAKSYKALLEKGYLTQEMLAKKMGLSQSAISNKLRLLSLSDEVQTALAEGKISERHARSLLQLSSHEEQDKWLKIIIDERITVKELDKRLKEKKGKSSMDDEIPIIEVAPSIDEIKKNATDIVSPVKNVNKTNVSTVETSTPTTEIPNKFFNFLEDESANMNVIENNESEIVPEEEIELLDVSVPDSPSTIEEEKTNNKDMTDANKLLITLEQALKKSNYDVNITKEDNDKEMKITITINKE